MPSAGNRRDRREPTLSRFCWTVLALFVLCSFSITSHASPSNGQVWTFTQPDGTAFLAKLVGDEFFAYYETPDGLVIDQDPASNVWYFARPRANGTLERTTNVVGKGTPKASLNPEKSAWLKTGAQQATKRAQILGLGSGDVQKAPSTGTVRGVLIFANFSDTTTTFTSTDIGNLVNTSGYNSNGASGSVRDFYYENSYGAMTVQMDVFVCTLPQTRAYYGQNTGGAGTDANPGQMASDAIAAVDGVVDFSTYDANGDGIVDVFGVAHQGQGEESGGGTNAIWSHRGRFGGPIAVDGKNIEDYFTVPERYGAASLSTIGVYCHEMAHHMFNLPDLYDVDNSSYGVGYWSVMGYGSWLGTNGAKPCHFDPWCKIVLGWLTPTVVSSSQAGIALPSYDTSATALLVPIDPYKDGEYFLVCNRYKRATGVASTGFDANLPASGALVLHVDDYQPNNQTEARKKVDVEEADGLGQLDSRASLGDSGDLYPNGASAISDSSTPNTRDYAGTSTGIVLNTFTGAGTASMTCAVTVSPSVVGSQLELRRHGERRLGIRLRWRRLRRRAIHHDSCERPETGQDLLHLHGNHELYRVRLQRVERGRSDWPANVPVRRPCWKRLRGNHARLAPILFRECGFLRSDQVRLWLPLSHRPSDGAGPAVQSTKLDKR